MEHTFSIFTLLVGFGFGYMLGRLNGFLDARPKRDRRGRFIKRK